MRATTLLILCVLLAPFAHAQRAGKVEVVQSQFDGLTYVVVGAGWTKNLDRKPLGGTLGGNLKVGAMIHSEHGTMLVLRVDEIVRILEAEVLVGDAQPVALQRYRETDIELSSETRFDITHSEASFRIAPELLQEMTSGQTRAWIRAHTSDGYIEADFGQSCKSRWPDRACIGIRKAIAQAKQLDLLE